MNPVPPTFKPREIQTRFLYPFFFTRGTASQACEALAKVSIELRDGHEAAVWECAEPPLLYKEELLDHVDRFLFQGSERGCKYLRIANPVSNRWFNKLQVILADPRKPATQANTKIDESQKEAARRNNAYAVNLVALAPVEVFLSNHGVGVLSIALTPDLADLDFENTALFNYKISQLRPQVAATFRVPHPSENKVAWDRMSAPERERISDPPNPSAPVTERLGRGGGSFLLRELIGDVLLEPLRELGLHPVQNQLSVYTVCRFSSDVDFEGSEVCSPLASFLSGLSQIEEPYHAGAPTGQIHVANAVLNRKHWAGVGRLGMAHIVADQTDPDLSFNEQRVGRVMLKYFVPYLVALLQRTWLHRSIDDASELVLSNHKDSGTGLATLRRQMLEFAVDGYFPEISSREVIQRYYLMIQDGLGVPSAFASASRAIADIDAQHNVDRQVELAEATRSLQHQMSGHIRIVANVQMTVEWIEIFLVSVYLAHLWEMFASHIETLHRWIPHGVIAAAILGALGAAAVLRPWHHRKSAP